MRETPWAPKTAQVKGIDTEKKLAKELGMRAHPRSGAGRIKHDASDEDTVLESKEAAKSHTLKGEYLDAFLKIANGQGKTAVYVVQFPDYNLRVTAEITRGA